MEIWQLRVSKLTDEISKPQKNDTGVFEMKRVQLEFENLKSMLN
jgi:hypothetical protein